MLSPRPDSTSKQQNPDSALSSQLEELCSQHGSCSTIFNREFPSIPKGWMPGSRELWLTNEFTCTTEFFLAICGGSEKPLITALRFQIKPLAFLPCLSQVQSRAQALGEPLTWSAATRRAHLPGRFSHLCSVLSAANQTMWTAQRAQAATCAGPGPARWRQEGLQRRTLTPCPPARAPSLRWCLWS